MFFYGPFSEHFFTGQFFVVFHRKPQKPAKHLSEIWEKSIADHYASLIIRVNMPRANQLTDFQKGQIYALSEENHSNREIGRRLNISESAVRSNLKKYRETGSMDVKPRSGRPRAMSPADEKNLVVRCKRSPHKPATHLRHDIKSATGKAASISVIKRCLADNNLSAYRVRKVPLLSPRHNKARKKFGKDNLQWEEDKWSKVLWSDESRYCLFRTDGKGYVRRPEKMAMHPRYTRPTVKFGGGSIMVWGCFSRAGVGDLVLVKGNMDHKCYLEILAEHMLPSAHRLIGEKCIYQQDNAPCHKAKAVMEWFDDPTPEDLRQDDVDWRFDTLEWPAQSPDLSPIENLWSEVEQDLKRRCVHPTSNAALFKEVKFSWENISMSVIHNLCDSMPKRCRDVIAQKGYHIEY